MTAAPDALSDSRPVPNDADIGPERITELLVEAGHQVVVTDIRSEPVGTGQMGASYRLHLTFDGDPGEVPPTLVAKVGDGPPEKRAIAAGSYRTEVVFYREVADTVAVRTPRCWASWMSDDATDFTLLLEDLAPRQQGDQIRGCTADEATAAVVNLAGLHGPRWCDPTLVTDGHLNGIEPGVDDMLADSLAQMTDLFVQHFGDRLAPADRDVLELVPGSIGPWIMTRPERFAPVHGDYRLDNLLFAPDGSEVAAVDWQTVSLGLPARDLAFLCSTGLETTVRRSCEDRVITAYHDALLSFGVADYPRDTCLDDYAVGLLQAPLIIVFGWAVGESTERGDAMFLAMTERSCSAIRDHDPFSRL